MIFEMYIQPNPQIPQSAEWHWQLTKLSNRAVIARSANGFESREECESSINLVMLTDYKTPIVEKSNKAKTEVLLEFIKSWKPL